MTSTVDPQLVRILVRIGVLRDQIRRKRAELQDRGAMKTHFGKDLVDDHDIQRRHQELAELQAQLDELKLAYDASRDALKSG